MDFEFNELQTSVQKISKFKYFSNVGLFVRKFTTEEAWKDLVKKNKNMILHKYETEESFRSEIIEIAESRKGLYQSWFPSKNREEHIKLVISQGAEYTTMGDFIYHNYKNPLVIASDHPKMKMFFSLNSLIPVLYLSKSY